MTTHHTAEPDMPPAQTDLIGAESGKLLGPIDYQPAEPGEPIKLGPPLWAAGTEVTVVSARTFVGDDRKQRHVLEVTRQRTLLDEVGQA